MRPVCFVDLDGVLVDFVRPALALHGKTLPMAEVRWDFPSQVGFSGTWAAEFWGPLGYDFWAGLPWTAEGRELLAGVEAAFGDRVVLMTSPCDTPGCVEGKVAWIKRELPTYSRRYFVGPPKALAAGPGKLLLDDHDGNVNAFRAEGGCAFLAPRPWNRDRRLTDGEGRFDVADVVALVRNWAEMETPSPAA